MKVIPTSHPDVLLIEPEVFGDHRGFFMETWHAEKFRDAGLGWEFVQDNHSRSVGGTLRGLHYQIERPQGKLVRVVAGEVFDVAVDLRRSSPRFGEWTGARLSAENRHQLWVPPGFAHGFYVTSDSADLVYKCTEPYHAELDRTLSWDDPTVGVDWPLRDGEPPRLSAKDTRGLPLAEAPTFP